MLAMALVVRNRSCAHLDWDLGAVIAKSMYPSPRGEAWQANCSRRGLTPRFAFRGIYPCISDGLRTHSSCEPWRKCDNVAGLEVPLDWGDTGLEVIFKAMTLHVIFLLFFSFD